MRVGGESVGPPLVVPVDDASLNARPDLDVAYERQLEMLTRIRRAVANVATSRKRLELQAGQLEQHHAVNADSPGPARPALWLSELRPGAPESADTRILFTVEPPGAAVLLAAGMESDWLRAWYAEAVANCSIRYQREQGNTR